MTNKFFLVGLLMYFMPSIVLLGYVVATMPRNEGRYYSSSDDNLPPLFGWVFAIVLFIWLPILLLNSQLWYMMLPYFVISYGLLFYFYRKHEIKAKQKQSEMSPIQPQEEYTFNYNVSYEAPESKKEEEN